MDNFHCDGDRIYLILSEIEKNNQFNDWGVTPVALAPHIKNDMAYVNQVTRVKRLSGHIIKNENSFSEVIDFVDSNYLKMFSFELKENSSDILGNSQAVISNNLSSKLFGKENPIGQAIILERNGIRKSFEVSGVAEEFPRNASFTFEILIDYENWDFFDENHDPISWKNFTSATFIKLDEKAQSSNVLYQLKSYIEQQNKINQDWPIRSYKLEPLLTLSLNAFEIRNDISSGFGGLSVSITMAVIGFFLLIITTLNYINISVAVSSNRVKEIAVRKMAGCTQKDITIQFIVENIIISFISTSLGVILGIIFFLPGFEALFSIGLSFNLAILDKVLVFSVLTSILVGIVSAIYPALYVSKFDIASIFSRNLKFGGSNSVTRFFLFFQFLLAYILVFISIIISLNNSFLNKRDWGYETKNLWVIHSNKPGVVDQLDNTLKSNPNVVKTSTSKNLIGRSSRIIDVEYLSEKIPTDLFEVNRGYLELLKIKFLQGRNFSNNSQLANNEIIVNEKLFKNANLSFEVKEAPLITLSGEQYRVVGLVKDFHFGDFDSEITPAAFILSEEKENWYLTIEVSDPSKEEIDALMSEIKLAYKNVLFQGFFYSTIFDSYLDQIKGHKNFIIFIATISIVLSIMGVLSLVSFSIRKRFKELGVRKVLGASMLNLMQNITREFFILLSASCLLGIPFSWLIIDFIFSNFYVYHTPITVTPFLLSTLLIFTILTIASITLLVKVGSLNPAEVLLDE